jgi:hypothetical protein
LVGQEAELPAVEFERLSRVGGAEGGFDDGLILAAAGYGECRAFFGEREWEWDVARALGEVAGAGDFDAGEQELLELGLAARFVGLEDAGAQAGGEGGQREADQDDQGQSE